MGIKEDLLNYKKEQSSQDFDNIAFETKKEKKQRKSRVLSDNYEFDGEEYSQTQKETDTEKVSEEKEKADKKSSAKETAKKEDKEITYTKRESKLIKRSEFQEKIGGMLKDDIGPLAKVGFFGGLLAIAVGVTAPWIVPTALTLIFAPSILWGVNKIIHNFYAQNVKAIIEEKKLIEEQTQNQKQNQEQNQEQNQNQKPTQDEEQAQNKTAGGKTNKTAGGKTNNTKGNETNNKGRQEQQGNNPER